MKLKFLLITLLLILFSINGLARGHGGGGRSYSRGYSSRSYARSYSPRSYGVTRVSSYTRRNGTFVQAHYRTSPDRTKMNNWSHRGNINPYSGRRGNKN